MDTELVGRLTCWNLWNGCEQCKNIISFEYSKPSNNFTFSKYCNLLKVCPWAMNLGKKGGVFSRVVIFLFKIHPPHTQLSSLSYVSMQDSVMPLLSCICVHCKNEVVISAKYLVTTVAWLSLLCNAVLERIHAVGADTWINFTSLPQNVLQALHSLN